MKLLPTTLLFLALATPAQAAITESRVTSPAGPTYRLYEAERTRAEPRLEIAATTDAPNQEEVVDIICSYGDAHDVVLKNQPVEADGSVETAVPLDEFPVELCDLRVVPAGYRGPDFSSYTGPVVAASQYIPRINSAPVRGSQEQAALGYLVSGGHQRAAAAIASAGDGGLFAAVGIKEQAHEPFGYTTWREAGGVHDVMVDGRVAYTAAGIPLFMFGTDRATAPAGFEGLQASVSLDEATGALAISESQRIFHCDGTDSAKPTEEECGTVLDTGIRLERTISLTREHSIADVRDRWVSSDGRPHYVLARYSVRMNEVKAVDDPLWRFPGDAAFRKYGEGDVFVQGPGTALVRDRNSLTAPGALSFAPAPSRFTFGDLGGLEETAQLAVPAGGAAPVRRVFAVGRDTAEAEALGRATEDGFEAPRLAITGATSRMVSGRASDNVGVVALTVAGRPAGIAPDGSFSVPVALGRTVSQITVTATDGAGLTATERVAVRRGAMARCQVPKVRAGVRVRAARAALRNAGCRARTRRVRSRTVRKGRVVRLSRRSGRLLPFRTTVTIRVSTGR
jgi:hypothetical protein